MILIRFAVILVLTVCAATAAYGEVTIRIVEPDSQIISATYVWTVGEEGATEGVFPDADGFDFPTGPITVTSVTEKRSGQQLTWEVVPAREKPEAEAVKVQYPEPIPGDSRIEVEITFDAPTDKMATDSEGRLVFSYSTGHAATVIWPRGHALVYSSHPVAVDDSSGLLTARVDEIVMKNLVFKTRAVE